MELSSLTLRVLLLFFPGVLCAMLVDALTVHRERTPVQFLTNSFVLGMASYLLLHVTRGSSAAVADLLGLRPPLPVTFFDALVNENARIAWGEITLAALAAVPLAGIVSASLNHRIFFRIARKLRVSRRSGHPDVWAFLFNSPDVSWIFVRDRGNDLIYQGLVESFSETGERSELLLRGVSVYRDSTGAKLYEAERIYFTRPSDTLDIEPIAAPSQRNHTEVNDGGSRDPSSPGGDVRQGGTELGSVSTAPERPSGSVGDPVPDARKRRRPRRT